MPFTYNREGKTLEELQDEAEAYAYLINTYAN